MLRSPVDWVLSNLESGWRPACIMIKLRSSQVEVYMTAGSKCCCLLQKVCCLCAIQQTGSTREAMPRPVKHLSCTEMCFPAGIQSMAAGFWTLGLELNLNRGPVGVQVSIKLSKDRKAVVSEFTGTHFCKIREYYEVKDQTSG